MRAIALPRLASVVLGVIACASDVIASTHKQPIIDGTPTGSDLAVVALADGFGTVYCSGTLISPRVVLTAAHCLGRQPAFAFVGSDSSRDGAFLEVAGAMAHPDNNGIAAADIAIVWLSRPTPIIPAAINTMLTDGDIGQPLRFVGFGTTGTYDTGIFGIKHAGYADLAGIDNLWLSYGVIGCHGDSGGPAFLSRGGQELLAGVTSHGDPNCAQGGFSTRVDLYADWILAKVQDLDPATCQLDGRCVATCADADLDCVMDAALAADDVEPTSSDDNAGGCGVAPHSTPALVLLALIALVRRRHLRKLRCFAPVLVCVGCTTEGSDIDSYRTFCRTRSIGDATREPELDVLAVAPDGTEQRLRDGATFELTGTSAKLRVHARNVDGCALAVRITSQPADAPEQRVSAGVVLELADTGEWGAPARTPSSLVELPMTPERDYRLVVAAQDATGKAATTILRVSPRSGP